MNQSPAYQEREPFTLPWTAEERAEFALDSWRDLFTQAQFRAAIRSIAAQVECHVEKDVPLLKRVDHENK
jgi:hypothetical protein